ncbi:SAM-dependent methyltransferase, partial [Streptomyces sp. 2MCAF27]
AVASAAGPADGPAAVPGYPAGAASPGRDKLPWQTVRDTVLDAWRAFDGVGGDGGDGGDGAPERAGVCQVLPVIELLDDDVDLAPARHLPSPAAGGGAEELAAVRDRLTATLARTVELTPVAPGGPDVLEEQPQGSRRPMTTVGELARAGALVLRTGGAVTVPGPGRQSAGSGPEAPPVLTETDVLAGTGPT